MPFGMKNSPATFQRLINSIIMEPHGCDVYIDDLIIASESWEDHIRIIRELFERLSKARLTINLPKSEFGCATVAYIYVQSQLHTLGLALLALVLFTNGHTSDSYSRLESFCCSG